MAVGKVPKYPLISPGTFVCGLLPYPFTSFLFRVSLPFSGPPPLPMKTESCIVLACKCQSNTSHVN